MSQQRSPNRRGREREGLTSDVEDTEQRRKLLARRPKVLLDPKVSSRAHLWSRGSTSTAVVRRDWKIAEGGDGSGCAHVVPAQTATAKQGQLKRFFRGFRRRGRHTCRCLFQRRMGTKAARVSLVMHGRTSATSSLATSSSLRLPSSTSRTTPRTHS